ncbi:hypothetical protein EXIGLDRAFT_735829 [Exidia glandulosa HHB12029]|uniref:Uncharacterized protein n=1 Tax=Exidia glandulosa HHB12029 TaxID=1314781 RepID=A0A166NF70_EXIGL|nr:hypothetical protein EXIGLDRAFT_735829 [Exidia glandulosa HHB12029]
MIHASRPPQDAHPFAVQPDPTNPFLRFLTATTVREQPDLADLGSGTLVELDRDTEDPPPIPSNLANRPCYYGFRFTDDEFTKTHDLCAAPVSHPNSLFVRKRDLVRTHAQKLGIWHKTVVEKAVSRSTSDPSSPPADIVWFVNLNIMYGCPTKAKIDMLRNALGVQGEVQWLARG